MTMIYCVKCKKQTETNNIVQSLSKNNRHMLKGNCTECGRVKSKFISAKKATSGGDLVNSLNAMTSNIKLPWAKFPGEMHFPGANWLGPGTRLDLRLNPDNSWKDWSKPVDRVDNAAYKHDLAYAEHQDTENRNKADRAMLEEVNRIEKPTLRERIERSVVKPIIGTKARFGLGYQMPRRYYNK